MNGVVYKDGHRGDAILYSTFEITWREVACGPRDVNRISCLINQRSPKSSSFAAAIGLSVGERIIVNCFCSIRRDRGLRRSSVGGAREERSPQLACPERADSNPATGALVFLLTLQIGTASPSVGSCSPVRRSILVSRPSVSVGGEAPT